MSKCIVIVGRSCTGKDFLLNFLIEKYREKGINAGKLQSVTTRPMRKGEKNGSEYIFLTDEVFNEYVENGLIFEHRSYPFFNKETMEETIVQYGTMMPKEVYDMYITIAGQYSNVNLFVDKFMSYDEYGTINNVVMYQTILEEEELIQRALRREKSFDKPNYKEMYKRLFHDYCDFAPYENHFLDYSKYLFQHSAYCNLEEFYPENMKPFVIFDNKLTTNEFSDIYIPIRFVFLKEHYDKLFK